MDLIRSGSFLAKKRREKNITQAALAEQVGVSNKTISKWETGKGMPDYSVMELLCKSLDITVTELLDGEEKEQDKACGVEDSQILELIKRMQVLESQRILLCGMFLMMMGVALLALHYNIGGSGAKDFISGVILGASIVEMLTGTYVVARSLAHQRK